MLKVPTYSNKHGNIPRVNASSIEISLNKKKENKVILIICDGMRADTAFQEFGYVNSLCDNTNIGVRLTSIVDNPSVSRTNYETLHTGVPALVHGITSNLLANKSKMERNIFSEVTKANKTTAVVGSSWFYDLYGKDKYLYLKHKEINKDDNEIITHGRFFSDDVPSEVDSSVEGLAHTFQISDFLLNKYHPDYLLIHVMTPDTVGHRDGVGKEYVKAVSHIDSVLGALVPRWLEMGYDIVITSDHGMDMNDNHGGSKCEVMRAPLYILSKNGWKPNQITPTEAKHIDIAPMIIERILGNNSFATYRNKLLDDSGFHQSNKGCEHFGAFSAQR